MTRTQYLARRWRRQAYDWLNDHDLDPRTAAGLAIVMAVVIAYLGHRMGA